jgi:hypothetical protein
MVARNQRAKLLITEVTVMPKARQELSIKR